MATDAEIALAFVAKRQGSDEMAGSAWAHILSLELGWMAPGAASKFVAGCQDNGLLLGDDGELRLGFDRNSVVVPRGFKLNSSEIPAAASPAPVLTNEPVATADLFPAMVERIASEGKVGKSDVMEAVTKVQERFGGNLSADAAAIRVAMSHGLDIQSDADAALGKITSTSK